METFEPATARILVVDDAEELREFYQLALEKEGYTVVTASDGRKGLELAIALRPEVIVTDVSMPEMDGLELLVRLRSDLAPPLPPVIVCSGFDMTRSTAVRLGAFRFLAKPLEPAKLLAVIALALRGLDASDRAVAEEGQRIRRARQRAAAAAAEALKGVDFAAPEVASRLRRFAEWIAGYFGYGATAVTFVDGGDLRVQAVSQNSTIAAGTIFDGHALYSSGVLASGASLVIADASAYPFASERARKYDIRAFVGVPLSSRGIPVGTLCLFDRAPRSFAAEDLVILEEIGRGALSASSALPDAVERVGLFSGDTFQRMLSAELSLHRRLGGSLDLLLVDLAPGFDDNAMLAALYDFSSLARLGGISSLARLGASRNGPNGVALFKRDPTASGASRAVGDALAAIARVVTVTAAGWVSFAEHLPPVPWDDLFVLARGALAQAHRGTPGTIERFALRRESWSGAEGEGLQRR